MSFLNANAGAAAGQAAQAAASGIKEPEAAAWRLAHTVGADPSGAFTSDLSVSGYFLLERAGFEPLGLVMGTSIYHLGIQIARWGQSQELTVLTQAMYNARELALARMRAEAAQLGADGIVNVELVLFQHAWGQEALEFLALGTAIRSKTNPGALRSPDGQPFTSDLSAEGFYKLLSAGQSPVAFVFGICVYHIAHQTAVASLRQLGQNQEVTLSTQGIYDAREIAIARMQTEATNAGASGIVGVRIEHSNRFWGEHATEFFALGTAIRPMGDEHPKPPEAKVMLQF